MQVYYDSSQVYYDSSHKDTEREVVVERDYKVGVLVSEKQNNKLIYLFNYLLQHIHTHYAFCII